MPEKLVPDAVCGGCPCFGGGIRGPERVATRGSRSKGGAAAATRQWGEEERQTRDPDRAPCERAGWRFSSVEAISPDASAFCGETLEVRNVVGWISRWPGRAENQSSRKFGIGMPAVPSHRGLSRTRRGGGFWQKQPGKRECKRANGERGAVATAQGEMGKLVLSAKLGVFLPGRPMDGWRRASLFGVCVCVRDVSRIASETRGVAACPGAFVLLLPLADRAGRATLGMKGT